MYNGKVHRQGLGVFTGPHAREKAQAALDEAMRPFTARKERDTLAHLAARISGREAEIAEAENRKQALLISEAFDAYANDPEAPDSSEETGKHYRGQFGRFEKWMGDRFPDVRELRHITKDMAFSFLEDMKQQASPNTYNKYVTLFVRIWKVLWRKGKLTENPWLDVKRRRLDVSVRRELTAEELRKVAASAQGEIWTLFAVGIYTGLRLKDAVRLEWSMIDLAKNHITIEPSKTARYTRGVPVVIPLVPQFRAILQRTPKAKRNGLILPGLFRQYEKDPASVSGKVQAVFISCGIETQECQEGKRARVVVGFHSLRHTFVSIAAEAGIPFAIVQAIVGHTSPAMTRHYLHVSEKALQANIRQFPSVFTQGELQSVPETDGAADAGNEPSGPSDEVGRICTEVGNLAPAERLEVLRACLEGLPGEYRLNAKRIIVGGEE